MGKARGYTVRQHSGRNMTQEDFFNSIKHKQLKGVMSNTQNSGGADEIYHARTLKSVTRTERVNGNVKYTYKTVNPSETYVETHGTRFYHNSDWFKFYKK